MKIDWKPPTLAERLSEISDRCSECKLESEIPKPLYPDPRFAVSRKVYEAMLSHPDLTQRQLDSVARIV